MTDDSLLIRFSRIDGGRAWIARMDGDDVEGVGATMSEALVDLRANQRARRLGLEE